MKDLSENHKHKSLALLMSLKESLDGSIKGHGVADRRQQWDNIEPKNTTSLTVSIEAVILAETIGTIKGRYMAVADIQGAYLSADVDDKVHVVFRGILAELMMADNPALYQLFVSYATGQAVIYVWLQKSL